jgi:predicted dehydrogenase
MFDEMAGKLDAVSIAIPDHMHYPVALWSLEQGINVYCEKPLVRTIWEARELKKAAAKAGVITQMGNQGHTHEGLRYIKEWTSAGVIGDVAEVLHWTNRPIWPQGEIKRQNLPVPATLDYDLWLGVAPKKSFDDKIVPFAWRGWKDYGCGAVGDMACHIMDSSFSGLDLGIPVEVEAEASGSHKETFPMASTINFTFADRNGKKAPRVTWYDGDRVPDISKIKGVEGDFFAVEEDSKGRKGKKKIQAEPSSLAQKERSGRIPIPHRFECILTVSFKKLNQVAACPRKLSIVLGVDPLRSSPILSKQERRQDRTLATRLTLRKRLYSVWLRFKRVLKSNTTPIKCV